MVEPRHEAGGGRHLALLHRPKPEHRLFRPPLLATRLGSRLCLGDRTDRLSLEMERFIGQNGIGTAGHPAAAGYAALTAHNSSRQGRAQLLLLALERRSPRARDDAAWLKEATGRTRTIVFSGITLAFLQRRTAPFRRAGPAGDHHPLSSTWFGSDHRQEWRQAHRAERPLRDPQDRDGAGCRRRRFYECGGTVATTLSWHDSPRWAVRWRRRITPPHVASIVIGRQGALIEPTALSVLPGFNPPA